MEIPTLKAEPRKAAGSRAAKRLRRSGKLPAIVYGHQTEPEAVTLDYHDVELQIQHGTHVVNLDIGGKTQSCLFKDAQYDHLGMKLMHLDLTRVNLSERVTVNVTLEFKGSPKGVADGGVFHTGLSGLDIECSVSNIPESIKVDVSGMEMFHVLYVKDLVLPEGVDAITDAETVVATVREPTVTAEEEAEAAEGEGAEGTSEPEVIARGKEEEESGGE